MKNKLWKAFDKLLNLIFPHPDETKKLLEMKPEEFLEKCNSPERNLPEITSFFSYKNRLIKTLVWQLKFKRQKKLAELVAQIVYEPLIDELNDLTLFESFKNPVLIPVPLYRKRLFQRSFNQSAEIVKKLEEIDKGTNFLIDLNSVYRVKDTKNQSRIKEKNLRRTNIEGCFKVKYKDNIKDRDIIIFDDVATTGSTLNELSKCLKDAGARKIKSFTLAH